MFGSKREMSGKPPLDKLGPLQTPGHVPRPNSPVTFQTMMNDIFKELIDKGVVTIYMDKILIFSGQTKEQHCAIVVHVLNILQKHRLYLKAKKCTFEQPTVEYLSLILSEGHMEMDPVKVAGVQDLCYIP